MTNLSLDEYLEALERMKKSRRDRLGVLGQWGVTAIGTAGGGLAAAIIGAKTVSFLGVSLVLAATPIGWVIAVALIIGAAAYWLTNLVRKGSRFDTLKDLNIRELEQRIARLRSEAMSSWLREPKMTRLITSLQLLVANGHMTQEKATEYVGAVEKKYIKFSQAFDQIQRLIAEKDLAQSG